MKKLLLLFFCFSIILTNYIYAQDKKDHFGIGLGININTKLYPDEVLGLRDLNNLDYNHISPQMSIMYRKGNSPIAFGFAFSYIKVSTNRSLYTSDKSNNRYINWGSDFFYTDSKKHTQQGFLFMPIISYKYVKLGVGIQYSKQSTEYIEYYSFMKDNIRSNKISNEYTEEKYFVDCVISIGANIPIYREENFRLYLQPAVLLFSQHKEKADEFWPGYVKSYRYIQHANIMPTITIYAQIL